MLIQSYDPTVEAERGGRLFEIRIVLQGEGADKSCLIRIFNHACQHIQCTMFCRFGMVLVTSSPVQCPWQSFLQQFSFFTFKVGLT